MCEEIYAEYIYAIDTVKYYAVTNVLNFLLKYLVTRFIFGYSVVKNIFVLSVYIIQKHILHKFLFTKVLPKNYLKTKDMTYCTVYNI